MRFEKVYFAPLLLSLGHCGCILDSKTMDFNCHMNNRLNFNMSKTHLKYHSPIPKKGIYNNSVKLLLALSIFSLCKVNLIYVTQGVWPHIRSWNELGRRLQGDS